MIKSTLIFLSFISAAAFAEPLPSPTIQAQCQVDGYSIETNNYSVSSGTFAANAKDGNFDLTGKLEEWQAYSIFQVPTYKAVQTVQLDHGYSVKLELRVRKFEIGGDFGYDKPTLDMAAQLLYNGTSLGASTIQSQEVYSEPLETKGNKTTMVSTMQTPELVLDNTPLRTLLNDGNVLDADTGMNIRNVDEVKVFAQYGDTQGVLTKSSVSCKVILSWIPTGKEVME